MCVAGGEEVVRGALSRRGFFGTAAGARLAATLAAPAQAQRRVSSGGDLAQWEVKHGRLPDGCCVAMHSGWAQHVNNAAKFVGKDAADVMHFPGIDPGAAEWLLKERRVAGLAVDTLSLDPGPSRNFKT